MKKFLLMFALGALVTLNFSCKKQGCTDEFADNYSEDAEEDDFSCSYSTDLVLYLNDSRYTYYDDKSDFYAPFHFYIDGTKIGELSISSSTFQTYSAAPTCDSTNGTFIYNHTRDNKNGDVTIDIIDQLGNAHGSVTKSIFLSDGACQAVLL